MIRAWFTANALYLALAALLGVSAFAGLQTLRLAHAQTAFADLRASIADANAKAEHAASETNASIVDVLWNADAAYQRGKDDAQVAADRVVADLSAGALKLRREWAGCETGRLADNAAFAVTAGDAERRRNESAGRIVRDADECVAQTAELIAIYNGVRDKINRGAPK